jgi:hypothetical protein
LTCNRNPGTIPAFFIAFCVGEFPTRHFQEAWLTGLVRGILISFLFISPVCAEKLVDPTTVAPEYREAAAQRRAEQIRQQECAHRADAERIMPRERTAYLLHCLEAAAAAKAD